MINPEAIRSKDEFLQFVAGFRAEIAANPKRVENPTLDRFLEALAAWAEDTVEQPKNEWEWAGQLLRAGAYYE